MVYLCAAAALALATTARAADEIHWTVSGATSVSFDWRGSESLVNYGLPSAYGKSATAASPTPAPWSSPGPFWEARLTGLLPDTLYHYSIGGGADHTFRTARRPGTSDFVVTAEGDIGSASYYPRVGVVQRLVADQRPAFTLMVGDLTYANNHGQKEVDNHFNDVMVWSQDAAYMPAWGNHEWDSSGDDLRNYKGRFDLPNWQTSPGSPSVSCCGDDWYWFDYGNVRFIAYPEPFSGAWSDWFSRAKTVMDQAQADPNLTFIVTFGHRPAYSSGHHAGDATLAGYMNQLGATHSKYKLNLNGHSHDYERTYPRSGVVHITAGISGSTLEEDGSCLWAGGCPAPSYTAFRAFHHGALRLTFGANAIQVDGLCGPAGDGGSNTNDLTCTPGSVFDHVTILGGAPANQAPDGTIVSPAGTVTLPLRRSLVFKGSGTDPDGDIPLAYHWTFGGAAPDSRLEDPGPVEFDHTGTYTVRLTVTDARGLPDPTPDEVRVTVIELGNHPPDGTIVSPAGDVTVQAGQSVEFRGSAMDPDFAPVFYQWTFGGAAADSHRGAPGLVTFARAGVYVVRLTAFDLQGLADPTPATRTITVTPARSQAVAPLESGTIRFALQRSGHVSVRILDVTGRRVRTVLDGSLSAGVHQYEFDGKSDTGSRLPAGIYFYAIRTPDGMITRRLVRLE